MEGAWSCYRSGHFNEGRMVMLHKSPVLCRENGHVKVGRLRRENGHVTEVVTLMEREWSLYGGGQFNGRRMVMLERWCLMEGAWSY